MLLNLLLLIIIIHHHHHHHALATAINCKKVKFVLGNQMLTIIMVVISIPNNNIIITVGK